MASITPYNTKAGKRWRVQYRDPTGKGRTKQGFKRKTDAQAWAAKNTTTINTGEWIDPTTQRTTITQLSKLWLQRITNLKPSTHHMHKQAWENRVQPAWGTVQVSDVKPSMVQNWVNQLDVSPSYARTCHLVLAQIMDIAVADGIIKKNPCRGIKLPRKPVQPVKVYLTYEQLKTLADNAKYPELVMLLGTVGLRWGEAAALRPMDLDVKRNRIEITRSVTRVGKESVFTGPKTGPRSVAVPPHVMKMLVKRAANAPVDGLLWTTRKGEAMTAPGHKTWFSGAVDRAQASDKGFPCVTPHGLRHVAAGLMIQAGANPLLVARQLGHASTKMTMDTYAHLWEDGLDVMVSSIGANVVEMSCRDAK